MKESLGRVCGLDAGPALHFTPPVLGAWTPRATPQPRRPRPLTCRPAPPVRFPPGQDHGRARSVPREWLSISQTVAVRARGPGAAHLELLRQPRLECGARGWPAGGWARRKAAFAGKGARPLPPGVPRPLYHPLLRTTEGQRALASGLWMRVGGEGARETWGPLIGASFLPASTRPRLAPIHTPSSRPPSCCSLESP